MRMRTLMAGAFGLILVGAIDGALVLTQGARAGGAASRPLVSMAEYERWQTALSNWGRWGKDDQLGTLNLVTPAKRRQAAALVKEGVTVSLSSDAATEKGVDVPCPVEWAMLTAALSQAAATRNRWEFMLTIAPLPIPRGTGSPVNPIAVF